MIENELIKINEAEIKSLIYEIRGKQVMLDSDVARLYGYNTKRINEAVKRNSKRFPKEFCFQLIKEENDILIRTKIERNEMRSQSATAYEKRNERFLPYVFTEQGIAMLSGLLKNDISIQVSINIMNAFVEMRRFILNNSNVLERLTKVEYKLLEHDNGFDKVFNILQNDKEFKQKIFFNGQIYDAHSLLIDIIVSAKKEIVIIDNYIDKTIIDLLAKKKENVNVKIITNEKSKISSLDVSKFNEQYPKIKLEYSSDYHDRFIVIDNNIIYHCGASLKDLGKRVFAINKMEDKLLLDRIIVNDWESL